MAWCLISHDGLGIISYESGALVVLGLLAIAILNYQALRLIFISTYFSGQSWLLGQQQKRSRVSRLFDKRRKNVPFEQEPISTGLSLYPLASPPSGNLTKKSGSRPLKLSLRVMSEESPFPAQTTTIN